MYQNSFEYPIGEVNLAGTQGFVANNTAFDTCISYNGGRPGDSGPKQFSTFTIRATNTASIVGGFPYQVANVESPSNPLWKWALMVNESTGNAYLTNGTLTAANMVVSGAATFQQPPTFASTNSGPSNTTTFP